MNRLLDNDAVNWFFCPVCEQDTETKIVPYINAISDYDYSFVVKIIFVCIECQAILHEEERRIEI